MTLADDKKNLRFRAKRMQGFQYTDVFDKLGLKWEGAEEKLLVRRLRRLVLAARSEIMRVVLLGDALSTLPHWALYVEAACREYVKAVLTHPRCCTLQPLWLGLSRVTDREAFLDVFAVIFEYAWT